MFGIIVGPEGGFPDLSAQNAAAMQNTANDPGYQAQNAWATHSAVNDPAYRAAQRAHNHYQSALANQLLTSDMGPQIERMYLHSIQRRFDRCCHGR